MCPFPTRFPLVTVPTPVLTTSLQGTTVPPAPYPVLPLVRWVGLDPVPRRRPPPHPLSRYSSASLFHQIQAKVIYEQQMFFRDQMSQILCFKDIKLMIYFMEIWYTETCTLFLGSTNTSQPSQTERTDPPPAVAVRPYVPDHPSRPQSPRKGPATMNSSSIYSMYLQHPQAKNYGSLSNRTAVKAGDFEAE